MWGCLNEALCCSRLEHHCLFPTTSSAGYFAPFSAWNRRSAQIRWNRDEDNQGASLANPLIWLKYVTRSLDYVSLQDRHMQSNPDGPMVDSTNNKNNVETNPLKCGTSVVPKFKKHAMSKLERQ